MRVALALALLLAGWAAAERWTVQTVAVRDYGEAQARSRQLRQAGFDAYTEFAMSEGQQYVRVRVGCHAERAVAEALAEALKGRYTAEAVPVPRDDEEGGEPRACVDREVGFRAGDWQQRATGVPAFEVEVGGVRALLRYRDGAWRVLQEGALEALEDATPSDPVTTHRQVRDADTPWVMGTVAGRELRLCPGRLLAAAGRDAIVAHGDVVYACRVSVPVETVEAR